MIYNYLKQVITVLLFLIFMAGCKNDSPVVELIMPEGLIAYYTFDGNTRDKSGNNNHAINFQVDITTRDRRGGYNTAYRLRGNDIWELLYVPNNASLELNTELSMSIWVKQYITDEEDSNRTDNTIMTLISKDILGFSWQIKNQISTNSQYILFGSDKNKVSSGEIEFLPNRWKHYAVTYNAISGETIFYYNGEKIATEKCLDENMLKNSNERYLFIGILGWMERGAVARWETLAGAIDDVRIYNRVLSEEEVKILYNE